MTTATKVEGTRGISPVGRVSYQHVFQPQANQEDPSKPKKFSVVLIFDPENMDEADKEAYAAMKAAAEIALAAKFPKKRPLEMKNPFRDGNVKEGKPEFENKIFVTFSTQENADPDLNPKVVGPNNKRISQESGDFYSGCYARVSYNASAFDHEKGNKGVAFYLNNIQKVRDGDKLTSRTAAEDEFEAVEPEEPKELTF
jgi:hypothetical protein